jgi:toxin CcdB
VDQISNRVVAPLIDLASSPTPAKRLNPVFTLQGQQFVLATQLLTAIDTYELGERVGSLAAVETDVLNALDMLFSGF